MSVTPPLNRDDDPLDEFFEQQRLPSTIEVHRALAATEALLFDRQPHPLTLGRHVLLARIGQGAHGVVYSAYDPALDRRVALKLIRTGSTATDAALVEEARAASRVHHGNVVAIHDVGRYDALDLSGAEGQRQEVPSAGVFLVMELVEGDDLGTWLSAQPRPWTAVLDVFLAAARGLAAAHACGVVHLDFKPVNVLVAGDGTAKVADFGLAHNPHTAPSPGDVRGTLPFMAPEQHVAGATLDHRADQYAFSVALYDALYGSLPFAADHLDDVLALKRGGLVSAPPRAAVPAAVFRALRRGLSPHPEDRFADMLALVRALEQARRRRWTWALAAGTAAIPLVLGGLAATRRPCVNLPDELAWTPEVAATVHARMAVIPRPYAEVVADTVVRELDVIASTWHAARQQACLAHVAAGHGESGEPDLCLAKQRVQIAEVVARLTEADEQTLLTAHRMIDDLRRPNECHHGPTTEGMAVRDEIIAIERVAARARTELTDGDVAAAQAGLAVALARAEALEQPALVARVQIARAQVLIDASELDAAEDALHAALTAAERGQDDATAVDALIELAELIGEKRHRFAETDRIAALAAAKIDRAQLGWWPRARLHHVVGNVHGHAREGDAALAEIELARALVEDHLGPDHPVLGGIEQSLGRWAFHFGDAERSKRHMDRAIALSTARLGSAHPTVLGLRGNQAVFAKRAGRYREALTEMTEVVQAREAALGEHDLRLVDTRHQYATILLPFGRTDEAMQLLDSVLQDRRRILGPDDRAVLATHNLRADVALAGDRLDIAEREIADGGALLRRRFTDDVEARIAHAALEGELLRRRGELGAALAVAERELTNAAASQNVAKLEVLAATTICELGRRDEAVARLRKVLASDAQQHFDRVGARLRLALCLAPSDHAAARDELASLAQELREGGLEGPHLDRVDAALAELAPR